MGEERREEADLNEYWELIRRTPPESAESRIGRTHPGDLVIATSRDRILVRIHADGTLTYGPEYTPDEAAVTFWTEMARRRLEMEERLIQIQVTERLLATLAKADLAYEAAQGRAREESASEEDKFREEMSQLNWSSRVHELIEFARGLLAARPDLQRDPP